MRSYSRYIHADSFWFEKIPSHWKKTRNKYLLRKNKRLVGQEWSDFELLSLGKAGIRIRDLEAGGKFPESFENYQSVEPGQLVFCLFDIDETPRTVGLSSLNGMITSAYDVFSCHEEVDPRFINYFYQSIDEVKGLKPYYTGLRKVVRPDTFRSIRFYLPPLDEQIEIADYLDRSVSLIDELVRKIKRKIRLIEERLASLINESVTKGLQSDVHKIQSGEDIIGLIPSHWSCLRLASFGSFTKGKNITKAELVSDGFPCILYSDVYTKYERSVTHPISFIDETKYQSSEKVDRGTFLFTASGETREDIGKCVLCQSNNQIAVGGDLVIFKLKNSENFDFDFLSFVFNSAYVQHTKSSNSRGEIVVHLYEKQLREIRIAFPPKTEQESIAIELKRNEKISRELIDMEKSRIKNLSDYRQSLISSAVIGRLNVVGLTHE